MTRSALLPTAGRFTNIFICGIKPLRKTVAARYVREAEIFNADKQAALFAWMRLENNT